MAKYEVWLEGKRTEWEQLPDSSAQFLGTIEAESFIDACKISLSTKWDSADSEESWTDYFHVDKNGIPYFAKCRLWDNEENARKRNG